MIRQQILEEFLKNIMRLSNKSYQERIWVRAEGPEYNDIDDAVCDFFDDGDPILEEREQFGITDNQYTLLMELHVKLRNFADTFGVYFSEKSTEKLIKLPQWQEIRDISKDMLRAFDFNRE